MRPSQSNVTSESGLLIPTADDFLPEGFKSEVKIILALLYSATFSQLEALQKQYINASCNTGTRTYRFTAAGAIFGNGVVAVVMVSSPVLRSVTNLFVMSLVASDALVAAWNMPLQLAFYMQDEWRMGEAMCRLTSYVQGVTVTASILTMAAVSLERYYAICRPIKARFVRTRKSAFSAIFIVWLVAILVMSPQLLIQRLQERLAWQLDTYPPIRIAHLCVEHFETKQLNAVYTYTVFTLLYVAPIAVMSFAYGKMATVLWSSNPLDDSMRRANRADKREAQKRRVVKMLITVLACFTMCWFPFFVIQIVLLHYDLSYTLRVIQALSLLLGYSNSMINPIVYFLMNKSLKRALVKIVRKLQPKKCHQRILQRLTIETQSGV